MKLIGIILIVLSALFASVVYERKTKNGLKLLNDLISLISNIKEKISYFNLPIENIYQDVLSKYEFITEIKSGKYEFLNEFDIDTKNNLVNFFTTLGKGFKAEQITKCEAMLNDLNIKLQSSKTEAKNKIRVFCAISFFICGCIIIFLL